MIEVSKSFFFVCFHLSWDHAQVQSGHFLLDMKSELSSCIKAV